MQTTIKKSFSLSGVSLHSGNQSTVTVHPAPANTGIRFKRIDLIVPNHQKIIDSNIKNISSGQLCTVLSNKYGYSISTIEHLMSAFNGLGIDNALVDINTNEIPILDGSSILYVKEIQKTGIKILNSERIYVKILKSFTVGCEKSFVKVSPSNNLSIDYTISYNHRLINEQNYILNNINETSYIELIAKCRTFGFEDEVHSLRKKGLIQGGSIDNAIVLNEDGMLNKEELRFKDEFVRHKILDAIGDIFIIGNPILAHLEAYCAGHKLMHDVLRAMEKDKTLWSLEGSSKLSLPESSFFNQEVQNYI